MFKFTDEASLYLILGVLGFIGWLIFGEFRWRDFSFLRGLGSIKNFARLMVKAPSYVIAEYDKIAPKVRCYIIFCVVHFPIPFLGFPMQLLHIPSINGAIFMLWGITWIVHLFHLTSFADRIKENASDDFVESLEAWFAFSFSAGLVVFALFDANQFKVAAGVTPYSGTPFDSSPIELLIAAFFLLPYLGFIGYLAQRHFFLKKVERQKIDDQALALAAEGYSMAGTTFKPAYKKTLTKTIKIEAWENLFTKEWVHIQGEKRSLHQLDLKVSVQDWGIQFEERYVFYVHNHGWDSGRHMKSFDLSEYRDYEKMLVETMNQYHPLELQRRYVDEEEVIKAHYANSGRAKIYELLFSTI